MKPNTSTSWHGGVGGGGGRVHQRDGQPLTLRRPRAGKTAQTSRPQCFCVSATVKRLFGAESEQLIEIKSFVLFESTKEERTFFFSMPLLVKCRMTH